MEREEFLFSTLRRFTGRRTMGTVNKHSAEKVNTAGVMPIIFASSLMRFPVIIAFYFAKHMSGPDISAHLTGAELKSKVFITYCYT